ALVVGAVALALIAAVAALVLRVAGREAPEAVGREEMPSAGVHDPALALGRERARGERHGEDLVRPQRVVVAARPVDPVVAAARVVVPEPLEPRLHALRGFLPRPRGPPQPPRERRPCDARVCAQ